MREPVARIVVRPGDGYVTVAIERFTGPWYRLSKPPEYTSVGDKCYTNAELDKNIEDAQAIIDDQYNRWRRTRNLVKRAKKKGVAEV